jgi:hypothetical protein
MVKKNVETKTKEENFNRIMTHINSKKGINHSKLESLVIYRQYINTQMS